MLLLPQPVHSNNKSSHIRCDEDFGLDIMVPTRSVTYVTPSISMSSLFANLTDFVGCSYIANPYFVAQSNPAMVMPLSASTRALIRYFRYFISMHALTCLLRTGRTSLGLGAVYEGDCIRPWFASAVGEGQSKCSIPPQGRQVYTKLL